MSTYHGYGYPCLEKLSTEKCKHKANQPEKILKTYEILENNIISYRNEYLFQSLSSNLSIFFVVPKKTAQRA